MPLSYEAKVDWGDNDIVKKEDVNRWEQGILDVVEDVLRHETSNDHDDIYLPLIESANKPNNCIIKGAFGNNNNLPEFLSSSVSYKTTPFESPSMTSNVLNGFTVTQGYYQVFKVGGHLLNGVRSSGTIKLPKAAYIQKMYLTASMSTYYIGGTQTLTFYKNGVKVGTATLNPKSYLSKFYRLPVPFLADEIAVGASSGSSWSGDGGGNASPGYQFYGYTVDSFTELPNTAVAGKDLSVSFDDGIPSDYYGVTPFGMVGSPLFNNGKYVSSGTTGLFYGVAALGTGSWCIQAKFKFNTTNGIYALFQKKCTTSLFGLVLVRNGNNKLQFTASSDGATYNIANVVLGSKADWDTTTEYLIRLRFTGSQYLIEWSTDNGNNWTTDITVNSSLIVKDLSSNLYFGISEIAPAYPLAGTMDDIAVTIGSDVAIQRNNPSLRAPVYGADLLVDFVDGTPLDSYRLHTLGVVGAPTYENSRYNQVSTVSGLNYNLTSLGSTTWCFQGVFKFASTSTDMCLAMKMGSASYYAFYLGKNTSNRLYLTLSINGTSYLVTALAGAKTDWDITTEYFIRLRFTGLKYLVEWSTNGVDWNTDITVNETTPLINFASNINIGVNGTVAPSFYGYIKKFGVTVGMPVFVERIPNRALNFRPEPLYYIDQDRLYSSVSEVPAINFSFNDRSTYTRLFITSEGVIEKTKLAQKYKDLYVSFINGTQFDDYDLNCSKATGSLTLSGNKITGTGSMEYSLPALDNDCWCIQGKFSFSTTTVLYAVMSGKRAFSLGITRTTANKLCLYLSSNGTTNDISNGALGAKADWVAGTEYFIRLRFTGAQYLVEWSLNGTDWFVDIIINSTLKVYSPEGIIFGGTAAYASLLAGTMTHLAYTMGRSVIEKRNRHIIGTSFNNPIEGDIWGKSSTVEIEQLKYVGGEWTKYLPIQCGDVILTNTGAVSSLIQPVYVQNGINVNKQSEFQRYWESAEYPIVLATPISITHNLGIKRYADIIPYLVCKYPVQGYNTGDEIMGPFSLYEGTQPINANIVSNENSVYQPIGDSYSLMIPYKNGTTYLAAADIVANFMYKVKILY